MTSTPPIQNALAASPSARSANTTRPVTRDDGSRKSDEASFSRSTRRAEDDARTEAKTEARRKAQGRRESEGHAEDAAVSNTPDAGSETTALGTTSTAPAETTAGPRERSTTTGPSKAKGAETSHAKDGEPAPHADGETKAESKLVPLTEALTPATKKEVPDSAKTIAPAQVPFAVVELPTIRPLAAAAPPTSDAPLAETIPTATVANEVRELTPLPTTNATSRHAPAPEFVVPTVEATAAAKDAPTVERAKAPVSVHAQERAHDILNQLRVHVSMNTRDALVQLHPIELGRISIRISTEGGRVRADVRAERPETLDALQRHLPELRASFARQGLEAQEFQLSLGFQNGTHEQRGSDSRRNSGRSNNAGDSVNALENTTLVRAIASESSIDTFA